MQFLENVTDSHVMNTVELTLQFALGCVTLTLQYKAVGGSIWLEKSMSCMFSSEETLSSQTQRLVAAVKFPTRLSELSASDSSPDFTFTT